MKRIAVLMGGLSSEREVSLQSGKNVAEALMSLNKYDVIPVDIKEENLNALPPNIDAVYIALHGGWGEDGGVQDALNALKIPYTGPGLRASQLAMDKIATKKALEAKGVPSAAWREVFEGDLSACPFPFPVVVKPPRDGSSVGITKCSTEDEYRRGLQLAWSLDGKTRQPAVALVEAFIPGREFTVAVVGDQVWPVVEIVAKGGWYGYEEKYNSNETRYPFLEDHDLTQRLQKFALDAFRALNCRGVTRVDFRVTPEGECFVLELNTSPGFTSHSLVPKSGMHLGLSFAEICDQILQQADYDR